MRAPPPALDGAERTCMPLNCLVHTPPRGLLVNQLRRQALLLMSSCWGGGQRAHGRAMGSGSSAPRMLLGEQHRRQAMVPPSLDHTASV